MFDHLVESTSHADDVKRKGSFLLVTAAIYLVLMLAFFVAGIYWYDAHLDNQNLELTTLVAPVPIPPQQNEPQKADAPKPQKVDISQQVDVRKELIADVNRADLVPKEVSAKASNVPPVRAGVKTIIGGSDSDAAVPVLAGSGGTGTGGPAPIKVDAGEPPPDMKPKPTPTPAKPTAPISGGVLNGKAIHLVTPPYPAIARSAHAGGKVTVQVLIDENGNVISANAIDGHPLLRASATAAARSSKFSPTKLSGQPVKVNGVIVYNFVAQ